MTSNLTRRTMITAGAATGRTGTAILDTRNRYLDEATRRQVRTGVERTAATSPGESLSPG